MTQNAMAFPKEDIVARVEEEQAPLATPQLNIDPIMPRCVTIHPQGC